jgi:hypothetical protein
MSELRKRMIRDMELRTFSPDTQRGYLRAVAGLAEYYHRLPDKISTEEIQDYIAHLLSERKLALGSCHGIITGLRFFYTVTLKQDGASVSIPQIKRVTRLLEILGVAAKRFRPWNLIRNTFQLINSEAISENQG